MALRVYDGDELLLIGSTSGVPPLVDNVLQRQSAQWSLDLEEQKRTVVWSRARSPTHSTE